MIGGAAEGGGTVPLHRDVSLHFKGIIESDFSRGEIRGEIIKRSALLGKSPERAEQGNGQ